MLVFAYCRDSGGPGQDRSVADQRKALEMWADQNGHVIGKWFVDEAKSGTAETREQFQEMIAVALKEKPGIVAVWNQARFARDQDAAQYYRAMLRRAGIQVISLNDNIPEGPIGRIVEGVIDYAAELQIAALRYDVKRGQRGILAQGFIPGARPPIGYKAVRSITGTNKRTGEPRYGIRWEIDEEIAPLVRRAFEMRANGESIRAIITATGLHTTRQGVHAMLQNPAYKGIYRYGAEEWTNVVPAIVDSERWEAAQISLGVHPRTEGADYLLTGLLRCGYCGYAMSGMRSTKHLKRGGTWARRYYICANRNTHFDECRAPLVRADDLESDVLHYVFDSLLAPEPFAAFVAAVRNAEQVDMSQAQAALLDRKIAQGEQTLRDLVDLVGQGIAVDVIGERLRQQETELRSLRQQRAAVVTPPHILAASEEELTHYVMLLRDRLDTGTIAVKRHVLHQVIERLIFGPDLTIEFRLPRS